MSDPAMVARSAGLRYVSDDGPGIRRRRAGKGFRYIGPDGQPISDPAELERIAGLGIPPAWSDVWICALADGHIQATGRDVRGRKQYRYHARWREVRDASKYERMLAFARALPALRERVDADIAGPGLSREKVVATVVSLLERTLIRVGNVEYARNNESYGLTTMHDEHVEVAGAKLSFQFRGKSGKDHAIELSDRRVARIVKRCRDLPGHDLFQYLDEQGGRQTVGSADVNDYLRSVTGEEFSAKDFRTWAGTVMALLALEEEGPFRSITEARKKTTAAVKRVAARLGNTPTIARSSYIHPAVIELYLKGRLFDALQAAAERAERTGVPGLRPEEARVLPLLEVAAEVMEEEAEATAARERRRRAAAGRAGRARRRKEAA
jgi:DNA topoisomerase-1